MGRHGNLAETTTPDFLIGGGETGELIRAHDWSATPLGVPDAWPQPLRTAVSLMLGAAQPACIAWGPELTSLYNDGCLPIVGPKHPGIGLPFSELWAEVWDEFRPIVEATLSGQSQHFVDKPIALAGRPGVPLGYFTLSFTALRDDDGRAAGFYCAATETTERVRADAAQLESEARFRRIADSAPTPMWVTQPDRKREFVNRAYVDFLGISYEDAIGFDWREIIHPDDHDRIVAESIAGEATLAPFTLEGRYRRHDGEWRWLRSVSQPRLGPDGNPHGFIGVAHDITASKAAEEALTAAREAAEAKTAEQAAILGQLAEGVIVTDAGGRIAFVNEAAKTLHGVAELDVEPSDYSKTYHLFREDGTPYPFEDLPLARAAMKGETVVDARWRIKRPDGTEVLAIGSAQPILNTDGKQIGSVLTLRDDTGRFAAEQALRELNETLESRVEERTAELLHAQEALRQAQKLEAMGQLTGGVAHDFNNLLSPIIGGLDMLQRRGVGDERARRQIDGALQSAERAKTLVQRLLAFARRQPLQPAAVDVAELVNGMVDLIGSTLGPAIDVRVELAEGCPPARADANQLELALLNLAVNARDAMPDGGRLTIAATCERVAEEDRPGLAAGDYVRLRVADTGSGMDEETRTRAVEPFFSTKGVGRGTGLGLSMVHGLIAQLGGILCIESAPGKGTEIELWLPVSSESTKGIEMVPESPPTPGRSGKVLLVDDEILVRMGTADMLDELGYEVAEANSAEEALQLLQEGLEPKVLVTDHLMPGMNGAELARTVRAIRPGLPVLLISGYAEVEGLDPEIVRLTKPFRNSELAECLAALMPEEPR